MKYFRRPVLNLQSGQAIIVVLLIVVVALTIGLSVTSRSVKDIKLSTRTEESQRAFSAAEAGLEAALLQNAGAVTGNLSGVSYNVTVTNTGGQPTYKIPGKPAKDDTQQVWLVSHNDSMEILPCDGTNYCYAGEIGVCWMGNTGDPNNDPALELSIIYKDSGTYKIEKHAYDGTIARRSQNNFAETLSLIPANCSGYTRRVAVNLPIAEANLNNDNENTAIRLRFLYSGGKDMLVYSPGGTNLPAQGKVYVSEGEAQVSGSTETQVRRIEFTKTYASLPSIFDFALFSNTEITK